MGLHSRVGDGLLKGSCSREFVPYGKSATSLKSGPLPPVEWTPFDGVGVPATQVI